MSDCNLCALMNMVHSSSETQVLLKQLPVILRQNILKARGDLAKSIELNNASLPFDKFDEPRSKKQRSLIVTDKKGNGSCGEQTRAGSLAAESRRREDYSGCYPGERAASIKDEETKMVPMGASEGQENSTSLEEVSQALPQTPQVIVCFPQSGGLNYVVMNGSNLVVMSGEGPPNAGVPTPHKKKGLQKGNGGGLQNGGLSRKMEAEDVVAGQDGTMATSSFGKGKEKATDHCVFELSLLPKDFTLQSLMPPLDGGDTANRSPGITATKASPSVSSGGGRSQRYSWPSVPPPPPPPPPPGVIPCSSEMPSQLPDNRLAQTDSRAEDYDPEKFTRFANFLVNMEPLNGINQGLMDSWSASEEEEEDVMDMEKEEEKEEGEEVIVDDMNLDASLQALADRLRHRMFPVMGAVDPTSMAMISTSTAPQSMNARTTTTTPTSANARITQGNEREHPAASPEVHIPEVPMSWLVHPSEVLKRSTDSGVDTSDEMADVFVSDWTTPHHVYTPVSLPHTKDNAAGVSNTPPSTISSSPSVVPNGGTELDDSSLDLSPDTLKLLLPFGAPSLQKSPPSGTIRHPESNSQMLSPLSQLLESFVPPVISDDEEAANISGGSDDRSNPTVGKANNSILPGPGATLSDSNVSVLPSSPLIPPPTASQEPTPIAVQQSSTNDPNLLLSKSHPEMMQTEPRCSFSYHHQQQQPVPNSPFSVELPTGMEDFLLLSEFQTASCSSTSLPSVVVTSSYQSTHQHNNISSAFDDATSVTSGHPRPLPQIQSHVCPTTFHSQTPVYHGLHSVPPAEGLLCNNDLESIMSVAQASCADDTIQFDSSSFSTIQNHTSASKSREASSLSNHGNYGALLGDCVDLNPRTHSDTVNAPIRPQRLNAPSLTVSSDPPGTSFLQASSLGVPGPSSQNQLSPHSLPDLSYFTEDYIHRAGSLSPHLLSSSSHPSSLRSLSPLRGIREGIQMELQSSPTVPAMQLEESDMMDFGALEQYQASSPIPSSPSLASISSQSTASVHDLESFFASSDSPSVIELCELLSESPNVQRTDFSHMTLSGMLGCGCKQYVFKCVVCYCVSVRGGMGYFLANYQPFY